MQAQQPGKHAWDAAASDLRRRQRNLNVRREFIRSLQIITTKPLRRHLFARTRMSHRDSVCSAFEREAVFWRVGLSGQGSAIRSRVCCNNPRQDGSYRCERSSNAVHGLEADEYHATFRPMGPYSRQARIR